MVAEPRTLEPPAFAQPAEAAQSRRFVDTWYRHIRALTEEIGPRGSTTEGERTGAEYCRQTLARLGYAPDIERFTGARSIFEPHLWAAASMAMACLVYPLAGRISAVLAALLVVGALGCDLLELGFRANPLRKLVRKGQSQNVLAVAEPQEQWKRDLVLMGHIDSPRTPIIFTSLAWMNFYKAFSTGAFVAGTAQVVLFVLGSLTAWRWIWPVSAVGAAYALALIAVYLHADRTPYNVGANDNASGVGLVLTLAERLAADPLRHTRVWLVCTGCEEVQHYGAADFYRRHGASLRDPRAIAFEMLGCAGPNWLVREGIVIPFRHDPAMIALAERVAGEHPELRAQATAVDGGNTEVADALRAGVPAIALTGIPSDHTVLYWHQMADTLDKIDRAALARNFDFVWEYVRALDGAK